MTRMSPEKRLLSDDEAPNTLAETLYYFSNAILRRELEEFRIEYESMHGETDLTVRYTSTWPQLHQAWLIQNEIRRYFDGLPPFVQAYLRGKMELAACAGNLDDMPTHYMKLFTSGGMRRKTR